MDKKILIAILARDKEATLPLYLDCIEKLDYDKKLITIYIRTNNNSDKTGDILNEFYDRNISEYAFIELDSNDVDEQMTTHHEWNSKRFSVLGKIRNISLQKTLEHNCDYYFVADCDNFILPHTLKNLLRFDVPIIAPMLTADNNNGYSNYHQKANQWGYFENSDLYFPLKRRTLIGVTQVDVVHCTYLIKADVIPKLYYTDETERHEYVIFSDSARKNNIPQYLDNTELYGVVSFCVEKDKFDYTPENIKEKITYLYNY